MLSIATKRQINILGKFDWSPEYEASHPEAGGASCICLKDSVLNAVEREEIAIMALDGLCWKETLPVGNIWHLTPRGAVEIAINEN